MRRVAIAVCISFTAAIVGLANGPQQEVQRSVGLKSAHVVKYEGRLPAASSPPALPTLVTFEIFDSPEQGELIWREVQAVAPAPDGSFTALLGASSKDGIPDDTFAGDGQRWLSVSHETSGQLGPRVLVTSVPTAMNAANADKLGGLPASAYLRAEDKPADKKQPDALRDDPLVSTGTANYIGKFVNSVDLTSSVLYETGSKVGLGTTNPSDFLHVQFTDTTGTVTGIAVQNLGTSATSYSGMLFLDSAGSLRQFQGYNNSSGEYRINNIASAANRSINFMLNNIARFKLIPVPATGWSGYGNDTIMVLGGEAPNLTSTGALSDTGGTVNKPFLRALSPISSVALGQGALSDVSSAGAVFGNTAVGHLALNGAVTGANNTVVGAGAGGANSGGARNVAIGYNALRNSASDNNIAVGFEAANATVGASPFANNIMVGSVGVSTPESNTIRIGTTPATSVPTLHPAHTRFFAAGISGVTTGLAPAAAVVVDANGQLGTISSSLRYKEQIRDMGDASSGLLRLRPVTFRYTEAYANGDKPLDYGLIAEEVETVFPSLVSYLPSGEVQSVQYHKLPAMLLNELQKQHRLLTSQALAIEAQERLIGFLTERLVALEKAVAPR